MSAKKNSRSRDMAIVAGVRTPFCKVNGALQGASAADLASHAFRELLDRTNVRRDEMFFLAAHSLGRRTAWLRVLF